MRVDCIVGECDEIDVVYIAYYDGNVGFSLVLKTAKKVGYFVIIAEFDDENIIEEYMTNYNQIIYEQYAFSNRNNVGYHCIIYMPNGKSLKLGESEREYNAKTLKYNPINNYARCDK